MDKEATPGAASAPQDALAPEHTPETDAAWDNDNEDLHLDAEGRKPEDAPADTTTPPAGDDAPAGDVITDAPALAEAAAAAAAAPGAKKDEPKTGEDGKPAPDAGAAIKATEQEQLAEYWRNVSDVFPGAFKDSTDPKFIAWFGELPPHEQAEASDPKNPKAAIKVMGRYYSDLSAGRVQEPKPQEEQILKAEDVAKSFAGSERKVIVVEDGHPVERTVGQIMAQYGDLGAAAIIATRDNVVAAINDLVRSGQLVTRAEFERVSASLRDRELDGKEPGVSTVTNTPEFKAYVQGSRLMSNAWQNGTPEERLEVIQLFRAKTARQVVDGAADGQRKAGERRSALHTGTLRGQPARPAASGKKYEDMTPEERQAAEEAAWKDEVGTK